jgi:hypothetical protein
MAHPLGRNPFESDVRDADYPPERLEAMIAAGKAKPLAWRVPRILDQGEKGTCVAAGTLGACDCDDETRTDSGFTSADILPFFAKITGHGPLPDGGAQVRNGLKAAKKAGYISAYSGLTTAAAITSWLEQHGPIVVGVDWFASMDKPNAKGFVTVSGSIRGGHCVYMNGDLGGLDFVNSWADTWGLKGHFYMTATQFAKLRNGDFEAWAIVQPTKATNDATMDDADNPVNQGV